MGEEITGSVGKEFPNEEPDIVWLLREIADPTGNPLGTHVICKQAADTIESLRASLTRVEGERDEARDDYMRRHKDATDRWLLLEDAKAALKPIADAARTLEMDGIEGYPFDDPREVLWAGEGGAITVSDFRRVAALHARLSRASGSELSGDQLEQRVTESAAKPEE